MNPPVARLVDPLALLASARHPDPFSVLGPHVTGTAVVIRAILPGAERVDVIAQGMAVPVAMERGHPAGVFEARLEGLREIPDYRLRVIHPGGHVVEIDDPFRFGRILTDFDLYLFGEGNHTRIYEKLGAHPMRVQLFEYMEEIAAAIGARPRLLRHPRRLLRLLAGPLTAAQYRLDGPGSSAHLN